ncbi:hypothetical protein GOV03_01175, partial [Candidatus Woesearchaeota archaeon]|nr:hypothetical protein [Candidatus Woesearchaeota archaeon]
ITCCGELHGKQRLWYSDGQPEKVGNYFCGKLQGRFVDWNVLGQIVEEKYYHKGHLQTDFQYHDNGQLEREEHLNEDGDIIKVANYDQNGNTLDVFEQDPNGESREWERNPSKE